MQGATSRLLILAGVFAAGAVLLGFAGYPVPPGAARWPSQEELFFVEGWNVSSEIAERVNGMDYISRRYWRADGTKATFVLSTSAVAKTVYRAGAEVPFHGSGYTVAPAPTSLVSSRELAAFTARKENEEYLLLYAFGERRGLLGNGLQAWSLVALDAVFGQPNDYFLARVLVPLHELDASQAAQVAGLAESLFPRLASWYGA